MKFEHVSVLLEECLEGLQIKSNGIYVDGTLGGAGHSSEICKRLSKEGHLIGIDQDNNALAVSRERLKDVFPKVSIVKSNFEQVDEVLNQLGIEKIDGMLIDLGVSSHQLDEASRGFSYMQDAPLDMRMNQENAYSAYEVVNALSEEVLYTLIRDYGEEKWAKRIAQFIVKERQQKPIQTTYELVEVIKKAIPHGARKDGPHPAKRTFQAIRIEVNRELDIIEPTIRKIVERLAIGGRLCIITFHSLEDRIVKQTFKQLEDPCTCSKSFPICICGKVSKVKVISRKPILPSEEEIEWNPRSRSAKLRIIERI
ncbi:16S rRNA (cytosine(1402)-N(4))-methyltransferase [Sporanaerobium hydrogeniformans]|uniref:16S rRNA (Cytosine(1402)-N(4))-methyltransferase n=1 Tax=Sporanaerobium hydrogeniformans TaxID=3072179 RepID=A0AC61DCM4_9FIRM|nr:16S rRNA (cytosine(1402)-N(4))-methyltransferase RsmH [Sporanaerobium hydrogeniformans]PHV71084.1 16S rRNA (cytosine(1402)-N(4))-methyltransferase [Sporanaerobium hydrogeniformans]